MEEARLSRRRFIAALPAAGIARLLVTAADRELPLICRDAWRARPPAVAFERHRVRRLTIHHSAVALADNRDAPSRFRSHQAAHQARGWPDIAYHVLIDRRGNLYRGRPTWARGDTATNYDPAGHLLFLCEGNFEEQTPTRRQVAALVDALAWACGRFAVAPRSIRGHRDWADTACPGRHLQALIADGTVRLRVRARLDAGGVALERLCGADGRARVDTIEAGRDRP